MNSDCDIGVHYDSSLQNYRVEMGKVSLTIPRSQLETMQTWFEGGSLDLVIKKHLIENRFVEAMEIDDIIYTKSDIMAYVKELGPKKRPV